MLRIKGMVAQYQGRLWEAIALLEGARRVAEQYDKASTMHLVNGTLSNMLALDDPKGAAAIELEVVQYARRTGRRESEIVTIGNMAEDIRRTGEWDWIIAELARANRDEDRNITDLLLEAAESEFKIQRGGIDDEELATVCARLEALDDIDVATSSDGLRALRDLGRGDFASAARSWIKQADGSDLNAPYALPKAGLAAVLAGDAALARTTLDRLTALGSRGRAIEADMDAIRAGIAAIEGDSPTAQAGLRDVRTRYRDLGLDWDVAHSGLLAAALLDPVDPEVAGWVADTRSTFERLKARPILATLERIVERKGSAALAGERADGSKPGATTDQRASVSST
jgi:hypothetical protein